MSLHCLDSNTAFERTASLSRCNQKVLTLITELHQKGEIHRREERKIDDDEERDRGFQIGKRETALTTFWV